MITARVGRHPENVALLEQLVDSIGAVVSDSIDRVNIPSDHPGRLPTGAAIADALKTADVVLVIDCPVPWVPSVAAPPDSARVIVLDHDPIHVTMPSWTFPVDLAIQCDPGAGLRDLLAELAALGPRPQPAKWPPAPVISAPATGFGAAPLVQTLSPLLDQADIVVEEATTNLDAMRQYLRRTQPGTYYRSGGTALGWSLGAALGVKLAQPQRLVVAIVGDGAFLFSSPSAALWALRAADAPVLIVLADNGGYAASRMPVFNLFPDGQSAADHDVVGTRLRGFVDYAKLAEACGAHGETVRSVEELQAGPRAAAWTSSGGAAARLSWLRSAHHGSSRGLDGRGHRPAIPQAGEILADAPELVREAVVAGQR